MKIDRCLHKNKAKLRTQSTHHRRLKITNHLQLKNSNRQSQINLLGVKQYNSSKINQTFLVKKPAHLSRALLTGQHRQDKEAQTEMHLQYHQKIQPMRMPSRGPNKFRPLKQTSCCWISKKISSKMSLAKYLSMPKLELNSDEGIHLSKRRISLRDRLERSNRS